VSAQPVHEHGPVPRDPAAIHAALSTEDRRLFDAEYVKALESAKASFSLETVYAVIEQWWAYANVGGDRREIEETALSLLDGEDVPGVTIDLQALLRTRRSA
jgi:Family of unknown function (DUF6247)